MNPKRFLRNYFGFSKSQTFGFMVLIPLLLFTLYFPSIFRRITQVEYSQFDDDKRQLDSLVALWYKTKETSMAEYSKESNSALEIKLKLFDPNTATVFELQQLGLSQSLAQRIDNYRSAGGQFRIRKDLLKIYGFPESLYENLAAYIQLPEKRESPSFSKTKVAEEEGSPEKKKVDLPLIAEKEVFIVLDINQADTAELKKLKGIGPSYSLRIVKYRAMLGGFTSVEQIKEVYGISDTLYRELVGHFSIAPAFQPQTIQINLATFKEVNAHPYITYEQTKEIMNAKSKFGKFKTIQDLNRLSLFDSLQLAKLIPYLDFR